MHQVFVSIGSNIDPEDNIEIVGLEGGISDLRVKSVEVSSKVLKIVTF